jgi:hypothetical protein
MGVFELPPSKSSASTAGRRKKSRQKKPEAPHALKQHSWRDVMGRVHAVLGGIIVSWHEPLQIGLVVAALDTEGLAEDFTDQPFVIIGEATAEQFERQLAFLSATYGATIEPDDGEERYYYFVETD